MQANLDDAGDLVLSEAAYILLATAGDPDAHELIRKITLRCEASHTRLLPELRAEAGVWHLISTQLEKTLAIDPEEFFSNPALYRGLAAERAVTIGSDYKRLLEKVREEIQ
jgi:adenylosuccinate lyase